MNKHIYQNELKPTQKMSKLELTSLFPPHEPSNNDPNKPTQKGYKHVLGLRKPVHLLGRKVLKIEKEMR